MASQQTIKLVIDKDGNPSISVEGVIGKACKDITRDLEEKLGMEKSMEPTDEMDEEVHEKQSVGGVGSAG